MKELIEKYEEMESLKYIKRLDELVRLGDNINIKARLIHLKRIIIDDFELLKAKQEESYPEFPPDREEIISEKELKKTLDNIKHGRVPDDLYPVQQEIRKILQSMLYHGYGIISAELDIVALFKTNIKEK
jgi:hypothetical protein